MIEEYPEEYVNALSYSKNLTINEGTSVQKARSFIEKLFSEDLGDQTEGIDYLIENLELINEQILERAFEIGSQGDEEMSLASLRLFSKWTKSEFCNNKILVDSNFLSFFEQFLNTNTDSVIFAKVAKIISFLCNNIKPIANELKQSSIIEQCIQSAAEMVPSISSDNIEAMIYLEGCVRLAIMFPENGSDAAILLNALLMSESIVIVLFGFDFLYKWIQNANIEDLPDIFNENFFEKLLFLFTHQDEDEKRREYITEGLFIAMASLNRDLSLADNFLVSGFSSLTASFEIFYSDQWALFLQVLSKMIESGSSDAYNFAMREDISTYIINELTCDSNKTSQSAMIVIFQLSQGDDNSILHIFSSMSASFYKAPQLLEVGGTLSVCILMFFLNCLNYINKQADEAKASLVEAMNLGNISYAIDSFASSDITYYTEVDDLLNHVRDLIWLLQ